jgi:hypothetical protein
MSPADCSEPKAKEPDNSLDSSCWLLTAAKGLVGMLDR